MFTSLKRRRVAKPLSRRGSWLQLDAGSCLLSRTVNAMVPHELPGIVQACAALSSCLHSLNFLTSKQQSQYSVFRLQHCPRSSLKRPASQGHHQGALVPPSRCRLTYSNDYITPWKTAWLCQQTSGMRQRQLAVSARSHLPQLTRGPKIAARLEICPSGCKLPLTG